MSQLKNIQEEIQAKRKALADYFENHKDQAGNLNMSMSEVEKARQLNDELTDLGKKHDALAEAERIAAEVKKFETEPVNRVPFMNQASNHSLSVNSDGQIKSLGQMVVESAEYKRMQGRHVTSPYQYSIELPGVDVKTTMTTSAGFAPESLRSGIVVPSAQRKLRVADLIPQGTTSQNAVKFMKESTFTNAAAERAENAAAAESALAYTEVTSSVVSLATILPITDEQADDVPGLMSLLNDRLVYMIGQREDGQLLNGDGNAPNLTGILTTSGIQTIARGSDTNQDAIFKAFTAVSATGVASADVVVIHDLNWQTIRLAKADGSGIYLWGEPSAPGPERLFGRQVVVTTAIASGTALVGDFRGFSHISRRQGITIDFGYPSDDFVKLKKTLRAVERISLEVYRPAAFCKVTSLN